MPDSNVARPAWERKLNPDPARSFTLPSRYYTDPEIFHREGDAVFFRSWLYVGHVGDLPRPGSYLTFNILNQSVFIARGKDMTLRAFYNVCQHRAHELVKGAGEAKVITCPYHAWSYHLTGELRTARGSENVEGFRKEEFCLKQVRLEALGPLLFINLDPDAEPLAVQAAGFLDEMRRLVPGFDRMVRVGGGRGEVKANWKVVIDNYLECYHCQNAHPAFATLVDLDSYRSVTHGIYSSHVSRSGRPDNKAYVFKPEDPVQIGGFWWLWPNFTVNVVPGEHNMSLFYILPLGPDHTLQVADYYHLTPETTPMRAARRAYGQNVLSVEDNDLCEAVQRGLNSRGYVQGRFIVDRDRSEISEHAVHHFHMLYADAIGEGR
ncbi:MAG: aromatic ring-hydroxylating dioxygenase subunit alpha [Dongiaceae bacterium]